jgi:hypothetical protein
MPEMSRGGRGNVLSKFSWRAHIANLIESLIGDDNQTTRIDSQQEVAIGKKADR